MTRTGSKSTASTGFGKMTRRTALASAVCTAALAAGSRVLAHDPGRQPNILFIMADDLGYADLSCYGRREYVTPVLDHLAGQGMMFTHAYANSAVCSATRVGLITGRYQYRLPVGLHEPLARPGPGLPREHPTLPSLLRDVGYATTLIGKWHMGSLPDNGPQERGYDEFWGIRGGGVDYFTHESASGPDLWDGSARVTETGYITDLMADRTITTLERRKDDGKPFLISLHFTAPHWPWEANDENGRAESERIAASNTPLALLSYDSGSLETYAEMVKSLDHNIGRVLARLAELDMDRDTIVVFTSDNGGERFSDTWPFTGKKTELLEGGMRIPTILRWPGVVEAGSTSDTPIMSMDWLPTFLAAGRATPDPAYLPDGVDLIPVLLGGSLPERTLYWRFGNKSQRAARRGPMKYLKINDNEFLFDVVADPLERANLKDRQPEDFVRLKSAWEAWDATMLRDPEALSAGNGAEHLADHFGPQD